MPIYNLYKNKPIKERIKEIFTLAVFTLVVAFISIVTMDILVYPISLVALKNKDFFNFLIGDLLFILIILFIIFLVAKKIYWLNKNGLSNREITRFLLFKPLYYLSTFFIILMASMFVIFFLFILLDKNQYLIYKLTGN